MGRDILSLRDAFDFKPLMDNFIGFDSMFNQMEKAFNTTNNTYPPYDIYTKSVEVFKNKKSSAVETHTFIEFAVAGISKERLQVEFSPENILTVKTKPVDYKAMSEDMEKDNKQYIRKGIAEREFTVQKTISKDLELVSCKMNDGLLTIEFRNKDIEEVQTSIIDIE